MPKKKEVVKSKFLKQFAIVFVVCIIATLIDFIVHSSSPKFYVDLEYYRNKIIFATLWGMVSLFVFKKVKSVYKKAFIFSGVIALLLHVKYFFLGYDKFFVFLFLFLHFFMFLAPALILFKLYKELF